VDVFVWVGGLVCLVFFFTIFLTNFLCLCVCS